MRNIDHLSENPGIVAVMTSGPLSTGDFRGVVSWGPMLSGIMALLVHTDENGIRVTVGEHTIFVRREHSKAVGVVIPTGHEVAKSVQRLLVLAIRGRKRSPAATKTKTKTEPMTEDDAEALDTAAAFGA